MNHPLWSANRSDELLSLLQAVRDEMENGEIERVRLSLRPTSNISQAIDLVIGADEKSMRRLTPCTLDRQPDAHLGATETEL